MSFHPIPTSQGAVGDILHLGASRIGVVIDNGAASLAMHDGVTGARAQCPIDRDGLLAAAGLMMEAAERLPMDIPHGELLAHQGA